MTKRGSLGWEAAATGALLALSLTVGCSDDESSSPSSGGGATSSGGQGGSGATGLGGTSTSSGGSGAEGGAGAAGGSGGAAPSGAWSMGYYASWAASQLPIAEIEWSGMTHVAMAFYMPGQNGSLSLLGGNPDHAATLVEAALAHGVVPVASIGGADSAEGFRAATASGSIDAFVDSLVALLTEDGYAGIDIDWEPLPESDHAAVVDLGARLRAAAPGVLLTIPIGAINVNLAPDLSGYATIADHYDQLNIMSYGMAGAWQGWNSWHSSPIYHQSSATPMSIDSTVQAYLAVGVPAAKLGIGIGFYGLCYSPPVTGPDQPLSGATIIASDGAISYANIMTHYYDASARQWDSLARVPYLSFGSAAPPDGCGYISYDDEQSIEEKGAYLRAQGLGGVIHWEINEGYLSSAPAGERNPLLTATRDHVLQ